MKTTNEYLTKIRQFKQQCAEKYGIISIGIFGSVARGEQHEGSDLDVFLELKERMHLHVLQQEQFFFALPYNSLTLPQLHHRSK